MTQNTVRESSGPAKGRRQPSHGSEPLNFGKQRFEFEFLKYTLAWHWSTKGLLADEGMQKIVYILRVRIRGMCTHTDNQPRGRKTKNLSV